MPDEFDNPASATAVDLDALQGSLLLIKPSRVEVGVSTAVGVKDVTVADIHVIDGPDAGKVHTEVFVFPRVLQAQLRGNVGTGRYCLGRLGQGIAKPGQSKPWKLADPADGDREVARRYLAGLHITTPTNSSGDAAAADQDEPPWART